MRALVRETRLSARALISPIFVVPGSARRQPLEALPGHDRLSPDLALEHARRLADLGVGGVMLFGVPDEKDDVGHGAADPAGPVPETLRRLREANLPLVLMADVCLCEYTTHGHCGALDGQRIDNDRSLPLLAAAAVAYAEAGADGADMLMVKPAITSLDLLAHAREAFNLPLAAYQVSGEYAMIEAAAARGWIDRKGTAAETVTAIARAGADVVISYFAADLACWLREGSV